MKNRITKILSVATTLLMLSGMGASASEVKKIKSKDLIFMYEVKGDGRATNLGGIAIDRNRKILYGAKSGNNDTAHYFFSKSDYSKTSGKIDRINLPDPSVLGHANGMTFYNDSIYVATNQKRIVRLYKDKGKWKSENTALTSTNSKMPCIASCGDGRFIVLDKINKNSRTYSIKNISGIEDKPMEVTLNNNKSYNLNDYEFQDIGYHKGYLYIPATKKETSYINNIIYRVSINNENDVKVIEINRDDIDDSFSKFEIESIDFNDKGTAIISFNIEKTKKRDSTHKITNQRDSIYKIPNIDKYFK